MKGGERLLLRQFFEDSRAPQQMHNALKVKAFIDLL